MPEGIYTLVQHSKYRLDQSTIWAQAVETMWVSKPTGVRIRELGGVTFDSFTHADNAMYVTNYHDPDDAGMYPNARGTFTRFKTRTDLYFVYIPTWEDLEQYLNNNITYTTDKEKDDARVL